MAPRRFPSYWRWRSRPPDGRPKITEEIRALIRRLAVENPSLEDCLTPPGVPRRVYVVAEKVTIGQDAVAADWPVCGTTGYDFLNVASAVFVDGRHIRCISEIYSRLTGIGAGFDELVYEQKKRVIRDLLAGELRRLTAHLQTLAGWDRHARDARAEELAAVIEELTACLPVYRTLSYLHPFIPGFSRRQEADRAGERGSERPHSYAVQCGFGVCPPRAPARSPRLFFRCGT